MIEPEKMIVGKGSTYSSCFSLSVSSREYDFLLELCIQLLPKSGKVTIIVRITYLKRLPNSFEIIIL